MRDRILSEIRRLAGEIGRPPGKATFQKRSGIAPHQWLGKFWATWGDALRDAGYEPNSMQHKFDSEALLKAVADATLAIGRFPTNAELSLHFRSMPDGPSAKNVENHFPRKHLLVVALKGWASANDGYEQIFDLLPNLPVPAETPSGKVQLGHVYLLKAGEYYKIGQSSELEKRVKSINVALPDKATLEHAISTDDPPGIEAYWHRRFADRRANGEWFKLTKSDILAFKKRKFQ